MGIRAGGTLGRGAPLPEPFSEDRLARLEERWHRDPGSRIFLQLAEELRRGGRLDRAVEVLRGGLARHPTYLSAQVALGRCLVEQGDAAGAVAILERAVAQDPTQLVASRLLIEGYLRRGDAANARSRLDLYRIFADGPDEIRALDGRIRQLEATLGLGASAAEAWPPRPSVDPQPSPFRLAAPAAPFEFSPAARRTGSRAPQPFGSLAPPADAAARFAAACRLAGFFPVAASAAAALREPERATPPLAVAALLEAPVAAPWRVPVPSEPAFAPVPEPTSTGMPEPVPAGVPPWNGGERAAESALEAPDAVFDAPQFSPREIGAEVERETIEEPYDELFSAVAPAPPAPAAPAGASVTLAELYLSQGHLAEAEGAFREVLAARPADAAARRGLDEIARRRTQATADAREETASGWGEPMPAAVGPSAPDLGRPVVGRLAQRKVEVLRAFLARIGRGAERRVP
jgi:tetratricopeptide (TPR) repeat protein